jgi:cobalt-zinc-cadmium efflux system outer membrane protein
LGKDISTYHPPYKPSKDVVVSHPQLEEPSGVISLRQALSLALMHNPELAAFSLEVRAGDAKELQASLFPNPELEAEVENFGGTDEWSRFDGAETKVILRQLIEIGGKRSKRTKVASLERDLAGWDYESKRLDVLTEVTIAFVGLLANQENQTLTDDLVKLSENVFNTVSARVNAGKDSPVEETKAKVALSIIRIEQERARRDLKTAQKRLAATWGSTTPLFEKVSGELEAISPIPPFADLVNHVSKNPDLARWSSELDQRQAALDMAKADRLPDITLGGGVKYHGEVDDTTFIMNLSIPLPFLDRNQGGVLEASHLLTKAQEERSAAEVSIVTDMHEAYQRLSVAFIESTTLRDDILPGAQSAFDAENEGYREGKFGYLDVLDAQRSLFDAKKQYIEALEEYHKAVAAIERLIAKSLNPIKNNVKQN